MAKAFISTEELERAISTVIQYLRDAGYDGAMEDGTGLADIVLKPNAMLYSLFSQLVERSKAYLSLADAQKLYENGDLSTDDYDAAVDGIMSNWFVTRHQGSNTYGTLRYSMNLQPEFLSIADGTEVATYGSVTFVADGTQTYASTENNILESDEVTLGGASYYIDIAVRSKTVSQVEIKAGDSFTDNLDRSDFVSAVALNDFTTGTDVETTETFIERSKEAITTRELITARAIRTVLYNEYADLIYVYVAGFGDKEQMRDQVTIEGVTMHYGSKADIYLMCNYSVYQTDVMVGANGTINVDFLGDSPFARILSVECDDTPLEFKSEVEELTVGSVAKGLKSLTVTPCDNEEHEKDTDHSYVVKWVGTPLVRSVHNFMYSDDQRVTCFDPMVRHMFPVFVNITMEVVKDEQSDYLDDEVVVSGVKDAVNEYMQNNLLNNNWSVSELIATVHELSYVAYVKLPVTITASLQDPATSEIITLPIENKIDASKFNAESQQVSENTIMPYSNEDLISVTVVSE
jgi:hypothetical protein